MNFSLTKTLLTLVTLSCTSIAAVKPARMFMDHMVIQRQTQAPVWGEADPGEQVSVSASWGDSAKTIADKDGKWLLKIQTPEAGGPHSLIFVGTNKIEIKDVLAGDVWLCTGQSNMGWPISKSNNAEQEIANAHYPHIRSFKVERNPSLKKVTNFGGEWKVCSPTTVHDFSATAYFTGRKLHKELNVPIGLLTTCWGGTAVESWTPWADQLDDPFARARKSIFDQKAKSYSPESAKANYEKQLELRKQNLDNSKKSKKRKPRKPVLATDPHLDQNYPGNLYNGMLHPLVPFAVKGAIWYQGEKNAKSIASAEHYRFQLARMIKSWRQAWKKEIPFYSVQLPNFKTPQVNPVEHKNIWPAIRESFVHVTENLVNAYTVTTIDLGEDKSIHPKNKQDVGRRLASVILNKSYAKKTPTTPFMKSFKIEEDKILVHFNYTGSGLVAKGAKLKAFAIAGKDKKFIWADAEIVNRNGVDCVIVSSPAIKKPVAVRYAWADNPTACNLFSKEGFPASPFRTDAWSLTTEK